jgi:hypothetical protein
MLDYARWANIAQPFLQRMLSKNLGFSSFDVNYNLNGIQFSFVLQDEIERAPLDLQLRIIRLQKKIIEEIKKLLASIKPTEMKFEFWYNGEIIEYQTEMDLELQEGYFFYPGGGLDFLPTTYLVRNSRINTFIYCDYFLFPMNVILLPEDEFELLEEREIGPYFLNNQLDTWEPYWHPEAVHENRGPNDSFAKKFKYRYINENREIELVYFKTEALGTYKLLCENWGAPAVMRLQDHGLGVGGYWIPFGGANQFYHVALRLDFMPKYILKPLDFIFPFGAENQDVRTQIWPGYENYLPIERFRCGEFENEFFIRN